jgi:hypothetical protein
VATRPAKDSIAQNQQFSFDDGFPPLDDGFPPLDDGFPPLGKNATVIEEDEPPAPLPEMSVVPAATSEEKGDKISNSRRRSSFSGSRHKSKERSSEGEEGKKDKKEKSDKLPTSSSKRRSRPKYVCLILNFLTFHRLRPDEGKTK